MKNKRTSLDWLNDILAACDHALSFVAEFSFEEFESNIEKQYAVVRALEIIGEAANQIPVEEKRKWNTLPWREMIATRNVVIHEYFGVDNRVIWRTVQEDIPELRKQIKKILQDIGS